MPTDLEKWAERETRVLIDAGFNPMDAERGINWAVDNVPLESEPETWIPPEYVLENQAEITEGDIQRARADWYARDSVPTRYKRILDAKPIQEDQG
jgi:hypothetical protein